MNLLCDEGLEEFIDQNSIYDLSDQWKPCSYGDEDTFWDEQRMRNWYFENIFNEYKDFTKT